MTKEKKIITIFKKQTNEIHKSVNEPIGRATEFLLDGESLEHLENDLFVKYKAKLKEYANIECTKYVFIMDKEICYENLIKLITADRNRALKHFVVKNHIKVKI